MAKKSVPGDAPAIDTAKISQGLTTVFQGYSMIFEALASQTELLTKAAMEAAAKPVETAAEETAPKPAAKKSVAKKSEPVPEPAGETAEVEEFPAEDTPPWEETAETKPEGKPPVVITLDDIAGVITSKLGRCVSADKKRAFNTKMKSLMEAYGCQKVSGLAKERYEEFLNDVAQITV